MNKISIIVCAFLFASLSFTSKAQEQDGQKLTLSGELRTDERFLLKNNHDWAWNETRLTLNLDKKILENSKFHSEIWLRNIGLPELSRSADLYNKGLIDPYNLEIREAYVQLNGFLLPDLDLTIGRQRIAWGKADKLNPTDNLNPYDMEDILDFGRHRGSDAISLDYYFTDNISLQGVYIPFFQPANMPAGIFSGALNPAMDLPQGMVLKESTDTLLMPEFNPVKSAVAGLRLKAYFGGIDLSASYVYGLEGLPFNTRNTFVPTDLFGGVSILSELSFPRMHIFGADLSTNLAGIGLWAEGALFLPAEDLYMTNDMSAFYPLSPEPVLIDSLLLDSTKPYLKFIVGADYFLPQGGYFNLQYMHGFIHERGRDLLNDYFFLQFSQPFFREKLKIAPLGGAFIVSDWDKLKENYALVYMPEITYRATVNTELTLSAVFFRGEGSNMFAGLNDYNMLMVKLKHSL